MSVVRRAARALITDPARRVLLVRVRDPVPLDAKNPVTDYWITVGGGVEPGESFSDAVRREVFEETGHLITDPGPCIWHRRKTVTSAGGVSTTGLEQYFWCPLPTAELSDRHLTATERELIQEFRWWDIDDPALAELTIFPEGFVRAAREILTNGRPVVPRRLRTS